MRRPGKADIDTCRRCDLWRRATQGVPGRGPRRARLLVVGEQPGDEEDLAGAPFVGPAGRLLDALLEQVGIPRDALFVTNAVKHFKWEPRGKRRLHKKPSVAQMRACAPWLLGEIAAARPRVILALGATAAHALLGRATAVREARGKSFEHPSGALARVTFHPSALLRAPDELAAKSLRAALLRDLRAAWKLAG